jgi:signal transduction histidine kinase
MNTPGDSVPQPDPDLLGQLQRLERRAQREREARKQAEQALEQRSRELYESNQALRSLANSLEAQVRLRTAELADALTRAEAATRAKTAFLATMSHELRTPMNGVLGMAQLLIDSPLEAAQQAQAQAIISSGELLLTIIDDILDFSKVEAGRMELDLSPFKPRETLNAVRLMLEQSAQRREVDLVFEVQAEVPDVLLGDDLRLRQILLNLASNAIKFSPGGQVRVRLRCDPGPVFEGPLILEVEDNGVGIESNRLAAIFEPFVQERAATARDFGGTGLGLAISQRIARLMGGELSVSSQLGQGSCFRLSWTAPEGPCTVAAPKLAPKHEDPTGDVRSESSLERPQSPASDAQEGQIHRRVLVAEDNPVNQMLMMTLLKRLGVHAELAQDGHQAWERLQSDRFDLVLMDLRMPGLDGLEVTRRLRAATTLHQPRVIAVTANVFEEDRVACLEAGMEGFLGKPFRLESLQALLRAPRA